jgi:acyl-coenzyme A thioesterase PaaI-like protein
VSAIPAAATALVEARGATPIGRWLNFNARADERGLLYRLGFAEQHIGNPAIRALHGGVIAAFLELAAQAELAAELAAPALLRTVAVSVDYLASSRAEDMLARVRLLRRGRRVAFLEATGWQGDEARPVASARICIRIGEAAAP